VIYVKKAGQGKERVGITLESLVWFTVLTAIGTVVGTYAYAKWVQPLLPPGTPVPPTVPQV
jgi:hypothetical protein